MHILKYRLLIRFTYLNTVCSARLSKAIRSLAQAIATLRGNASALHCVQQVLIYVGGFVHRVHIVLHVHCEFFLALIRIMSPLENHIVWVVSLKLFDILLMQKGIIFIGPVHARQIAGVKKIHCSARQSVCWVAVVEQGLLLFVPIRLVR